MMTKVLAWLLGTKIGRTILATLAVCLVVLLSWLAFKTHYFNAGVASCQLGRATDTNAANVAQGEKNSSNNKTSSGISATSDAAAQTVVDEAQKDNQDSKETINETYSKPPVTAPVAIGSCVHPLDDRVQDRIKAARASAAGT